MGGTDGSRFLDRVTIITTAALAAVILLAWLWLIGQSDMSDAMVMPGMVAVEPWSPGYLLPAFAMWALMMVAMMLPSAAPMILFHARFVRRSGAPDALPSTLVFAAAYVAIWTLFSAIAALLQAALLAAGAISAMELALGDRRLAGGLLLLAALWQLSTLKTACLRTCRSPFDFLMRLWRPGLAGALRLGTVHGLYCLGCCWALMLLLFVAGVMNLAWVAVLALMVLAEKTAPPRLPVRQGLAVLLGGAGAYLLVTA